MKTFANLPADIENAIADMIARQDSNDWVQHAIQLHEHYMERKSQFGKVALQSKNDSLAYLALRIPATYAQLFGALEQVKELLPSWKPTSLLDLGSGPGTGTWAAKEIWPSISESTSLDYHFEFLTIGKQLYKSTENGLAMHWEQVDLRKGIPIKDKQFDVIIIANVLNELSPAITDKIIGQAFELCKGILVIIEPGTPAGSSITENAARKLAKAGYLLAPYIGNTFVSKPDYYIHFPQRFIRPEFQRRIRQHMRENTLMASAWEEAKYTYTVISKLKPEVHPWGRCVGSLHIQKGFLEIPVLTKDGIEKVKVMKRNHEPYAYAKDLKWGQLVEKNSLLL